MQDYNREDPQDGTAELMPQSHESEAAVVARYSSGAQAREAALCCPVIYDTTLLEAIPEEIIARDYGCGDPSRYVREGEVVLDLGSGGGKICYIAAQVVGPTGRVIGVDMNDDMLDLARRHRAPVAETIGHDVVSFKKGRIQDLALDLDAMDAFLGENPVSDLAGLDTLRRHEATLRETPMVADDSIDIVLSNCVLNLVPAAEKRQLFQEIFRVVKVGGRVAISDIVSDEDVPARLQSDPELWSGCISGALREDKFIAAFEEVGFYGVEISKRDDEPWRTVEGIEFRSVTVTAYKGKEGDCWERNQAVIYRGPFKSVTDDDNHFYNRGQLTAVCDKTLKTLAKAPYEGHFIAVQPKDEIPLEEAEVFDCDRPQRRHARELKGLRYDLTTEADESCC